MKYAVIGAGNAGKATCAYLMSRGRETVLYNRSAEIPQRISQCSLTSTGVISGCWRPVVTTSIEEAAACDVILVQTTASGHRPIAQALHGLLRPGQVILVFNSCWGAIEFDEILCAEADEKGVLIGEASSQIFLCSSLAPEQVHIKTIKASMSVACVHADKTERLLHILIEDFPQLYCAENILHTSFGSTNPLIHTPLVLFNATRMENAEEYLLFKTGVTPRVASCIESLDRERIMVAAACGITLQSLLELLNISWNQNWSTVYEALHSNPAYQVTTGPKILESRYISEDIPYGICPVIRLGQKYNVKTDAMHTVLSAIQLLMGRDYFSKSPHTDECRLERYI